eukprot:6242429-Prorocentrum_lima.AAC.1
MGQASPLQTRARLLASQDRWGGCVGWVSGVCSVCVVCACVCVACICLRVCGWRNANRHIAKLPVTKFRSYMGKHITTHWMRRSRVTDWIRMGMPVACQILESSGGGGGG